MGRLRVLTVSVAIGATVLTGCGKSSPSTQNSSSTTSSSSTNSTPSTTPTQAKPSGTRTLSSSPSVTSPEELKAEAFRIYREFFAAKNRVLASSGTEESPDLVREYLGKEYFKHFEEFVQENQRKGIRKVGGESPTLIGPEVYTTPLTQGAVLAIRSCDDGRKMVLTNGQKQYPGGLGVNVTQFGYEDGKLKMIYNEGKQVDQCPIK